MTNTARFLHVITTELGTIQTKASDPLDATIGELGADSMDRILIAMELENEFLVEISDDEMDLWVENTTLRDILILVESKLT